MTFDEIVDEVMDRLNLTSLEARERVEGRVNDRYRRVTSSIGLQTSRRSVQENEYDPTDPDTELPEVVVTGMEKILKIFYTDADNNGITVLKEKTYDEVTNLPTIDRLPKCWAVKLMGPSEVRILLDAFPPTTSFTLKFEGYENALELEGSLEPYFPEDFHDILVAGAMADELDKMEKPQLASKQEEKYERRMSDLRMFISKSILLDIVQGKDKPGYVWYRPWYSRNGVLN